MLLSKVTPILKKDKNKHIFSSDREYYVGYQPVMTKETSLITSLKFEPKIGPTLINL